MAWQESLSLILLLVFFASAEAGYIGVNYGTVADNLPPAEKVVELLKSQKIDRVKLYDTNPVTFKALAGSGIKTTVALPNEVLIAVAKRPSQAYYWVQKNIAQYYPSTLIHAIAVGNEVFVNPQNLTNYLVPAMTNVHAALVKYKLDSTIKVSSPIALSALQTSYPSSAGAFSKELVEPVMKPMLDFLRKTGSYLMVNAYPFFAYEANTDVISLDYALFRPNAGVVDQGNGLKYDNLFDAQVDAVFAAMSALKYDDVEIVVTETGWPSKGDKNEPGASPSNAEAYNGNLIRRMLVGGGTPLRPKASLEVYLFALFNENKKPGPASERNYGLFYPNEQKVYEISFSASAAKEAPEVNHAVVVTSSTGQTWCVADASAGEEKLQAALDYACGEGGADCRSIQPGAACYNPNSLEAHASYALNSYYQKHGRGTGTCYFNGVGRVVSKTPSRIFRLKGCWVNLR